VDFFDGSAVSQRGGASGFRHMLNYQAAIGRTGNASVMLEWGKLTVTS
jgi:hypothetical protein